MLFAVLNWMGIYWFIAVAVPETVSTVPSDLTTNGIGINWFTVSPVNVSTNNPRWRTFTLKSIYEVAIAGV